MCKSVIISLSLHQIISGSLGFPVQPPRYSGVAIVYESSEKSIALEVKEKTLKEMVNPEDTIATSL